MPELATATTSEPMAQATEPSAAVPSAPAAPAAEAKIADQLASFADALTKSAPTPDAAGTAEGTKGDGAKGTSKGGASTPPGVSNPPDARQQAPEQQTDPTAAAASTPDGVSKPEVEQGEQKPGQDEPGQGGISRRSAAKEIERLNQEVAALKSGRGVPPEVLSQVEQYRLSDEAFTALEAKLKREDLTGVRLTPEERERYNVALTFREWFAPVYQHSLQSAKQWEEGARAQIFDDQAKELAPLLRDRPYVKGEVIARAESWSDVYGHIADASLEEGRRVAQAELQPKLDEAAARIADLEAALGGLRPVAAARSVRPLERGGTATGGSRERPNIRTAKSASELFDAGFAEAEKRSRRAS